MLPACLLALTSGVGLWASYAPLNFSPLAWFAPVPLLLLARLVTSPHRLFLAAYLGGLAFYLPLSNGCIMATLPCMWPGGHSLFIWR